MPSVHTTSQLRLRRRLEPRRKRRPSPLPNRRDDAIDLLQQPQAPLITRQPLPAHHFLLARRLRRAVLVRLPQPEDVAHDLRADAGLRAQHGHGQDGHEHAADVGEIRVPAPGVDGIGEEGAVFAFDDEDGQVRMRLGELVGQLGAERAVDAFPEAVAARERRLDRGRVQMSGGCAGSEMDWRVEAGRALDPLSPSRLALLELRLHVGGEPRVELAERVDGPWHLRRGGVSAVVGRAGLWRCARR